MNPQIVQIDPLDPFLSVSALRKAGLAFAGNADPARSGLSPINGPLEGLGRISIFIGTRDILVADARRLNAIAAKLGVSINYREYEDMVHVWMFLNFPEAEQAKREIMEIIRGLSGNQVNP